MLAQKITNHCSISSSGGPERERERERDGGGGKTYAVIRGAFCVGRSGGHRKEGRKEMNQAEGEEEERSGGRLVEEVQVSLAC